MHPTIKFPKAHTTLSKHELLTKILLTPVRSSETRVQVRPVESAVDVRRRSGKSGIGVVVSDLDPAKISGAVESGVHLRSCRSKGRREEHQENGLKAGFRGLRETAGGLCLHTISLFILRSGRDTRRDCLCLFLSCYPSDVF